MFKFCGDCGDPNTVLESFYSSKFQTYRQPNLVPRVSSSSGDPGNEVYRQPLASYGLKNHVASPFNIVDILRKLPSSTYI